ncbi:amino acid ABC transporter substrate-binding protein [Thalassomonas sp. RHCl1]|uniref:amino acid ABC transporter substrate-binding protein n=1 Tax=Thalassomonas sp. RHCl1 TaxID=2995320 RepID=UPI00248BC709|nr:amino acid ABC transporter substrate-binding protein [Thalassomonas sp. RHCl1]
MALLLTNLFTHAQPVIHIGAPLPFTGKLALEAAKQQRGYELWADIINKQGGIDIGGRNHAVRIVYIDYQSDSAKAREAVETLVGKDNVNLLFAPYGSMAAREASAVAQKHHVPMIAVTASSYQAYSRGHKYLFGIFTPNETLIEPLMDLVKQTLPLTDKVALLVRKDLFPLSIAREVKISSQKREMNIVLYSPYAIDASDHSLALQQLKNLRPNWIFALGYTADLIFLRQQMAKLDITAPVLTMIAAPAYQEFIDAVGPLAENVTSAAWWHPAVQYTGSDIFGTTANFVQAFQNRYGKLPDYVEASAALAGVLFQLSLERAESIEGELVRNELAKINETTFWGPVRFGQNGQNNALIPLVFQIQQSKPVIIYPTAVATGKLLLGVK